MSLNALQLDARHKGLGGSDAAAACGRDPYKSALALYHEKRQPPGLKTQTPQMLWGTLLEPVIRQQYANLTGRIVRLPTGTLYHPKHRFILAHVDGVTDDKRLFEAKTARIEEGWGERGSDEIPESYVFQVQHYLAVTQLPVADIAVLIGGSDFRLYEVPADAELQEMVIEAEADFWARVENAAPPDPDFHQTGTAQLIARIYPGTSGEQLIANAEQLHWYHAYLDADHRAKTYQAAVDAAKAHLLWSMRDASTMSFDDGRFLRRKKLHRRGYTTEVAPTDYIDARFMKSTGGSDE